jgi:5,6-dimethylbenzimidazole synthase
MDIFSVIKERRSCRSFLPDPVPESDVDKLIEAAVNAPSPLNSQPWNFIVITGIETKMKIHAEGSRCRQFLIEKTGWKWLGHYDVEFLKAVPVMVCVLGDPKKSGSDIFMEGGIGAWRDACGAAIQNMMLAAHTLGLASLWYTMFDKGKLNEILGVNDVKFPIGLVCLGKAASSIPAVPRKGLNEVVKYVKT